MLDKHVENVHLVCNELGSGHCHNNIRLVDFARSSSFFYKVTEDFVAFPMTSLVLNTTVRHHLTSGAGLHEGTSVSNETEAACTGAILGWWFD